MDIVAPTVVRHERAPEISASKVTMTLQHSPSVSLSLSLWVQHYQVGAEYQLKLSSSFPSMKKRRNCLLCVRSQIARRAHPYYVASAAAQTGRREACLPWLPRGSSIQKQPDRCSCFCSQGFPQANSDAFLPCSCHLHLGDRISFSLFFFNFNFLKWDKNIPSRLFQLQK